jgi:hypothetical protein
MAAALSILLVVIGAALKWAMDGNVGGVDTTLVGAVAMIVGGLALLASLIVESRREAGRQRAMREPDEDAGDRDDRYDIARFQ